MQEISDILSPGKKLSTDGAFCRRGAWRTLGRRGVAIRVPAEMPGKLAPLRANSQPLSYSPKVLLSAMPCRKENGLSRRFAPRNDRRGGVLANRCKMGTGAHLCGPEKAMQRSDLSPGFSGGKAGAKDAQLVSPRCGNPHPRRETWQLCGCLGKFVTRFVFARSTTFRYALPQENGLSRRGAAAPLLAMTCRNMRLSAVATMWCHGKFVTPCAFALSTALRPAGAILCCNSFTPGASGRQSPVWPKCCRRAPPAPG